jgi:hypothetical protein
MHAATAATAATRAQRVEERRPTLSDRRGASRRRPPPIGECFYPFKVRKKPYQSGRSPSRYGRSTDLGKRA